ncbi:MAG: DEAD/DEAH box helicase [Metallibacterium sp.]
MSNSILITLENNGLCLKFNHDTSLTKTLKDILPFNLRIFNAINKTWHISLINPKSVDYFYSFLESIKDHAVIEIEPLAKSFIISKHNEYSKNIEMSQSLKSSIPNDDIKIDHIEKLREFQKTAVEYVSEHRHTFIVDPVGCGKTVEVISSLQYLKAYPALVVVPAIAISTWEREIKFWLANQNVSYSILHTTQKGINLTTDIVITTYDMVKKYLIELQTMPFKTLVLDESHLVKDKKTQRFKSLIEVAKDKENVILMSATPIANKPIDLIAQLEIMGMFKPLFKSVSDFTQRYCDVEETAGASNIDELKDILRANCMIVRSKKEIMPEMPETTRIPFEIRLSSKYREMYKRAVDDISNWYYDKTRHDLIDKITDGNLTRKELAYIEEQSIKQKAKGKSLSHEALIRLNALRQIAGMGKLESIKEWLDVFLGNDEKLVIFVDHHDVLAKLVQLYPSSAFIHGKLSPANRGKQIQRFWEDKDCKFIIASIRAAGVSIDLQNASNALFVEMWWTATAHTQAEGRLERHGQKNAMTMYYALMADIYKDKPSIDNEMYNLIQAKMAVADTFKAKTGIKDMLGILKKIAK